MMGVRTAIAGLLLLLAISASAETSLIEAGRDATLIEDPGGALANGSGPALFVGRTSQRENGVRRSLVYFDIATVLPENAVIESARLILYMSPSNAAPRRIDLHRLLDAWGEGSSSASGGGGAASVAGDATWIHTFYDEEFWVRPGGHFVARASASQEVAASAFYAWEATPKLLADLRLWHRSPRSNFGWILLGDESTPQNVKSFASREASDPSLRPVLEVTYRVLGE